jgi:flagellar basal-body rod protein FlgC
MGFFDAMDISSSGLSAQRIRMNAISSNLANKDTVRTENGEPYRRKEVLLEAKPYAADFDAELNRHLNSKLHKVAVRDITADPRPFISKYDPQHPDANEAGYVAYPNINIIEEMANMLLANRSYEANLAAVNASKKMALKALEIGK